MFRQITLYSSGLRIKNIFPTQFMSILSISGVFSTLRTLQRSKIISLTACITTSVMKLEFVCSTHMDQFSMMKKSVTTFFQNKNIFVKKKTLAENPKSGRILSNSQKQQSCVTLTLRAEFVIGSRTQKGIQSLQIVSQLHFEQIP